jgi:hypothetical protein
MKFMILFETLANVFRHITLRTRQVQPLPLDDETRHQRGARSSQVLRLNVVNLTRSGRVRDLTGQLLNIPWRPAASGGYSDVWKCDWIKHGAVVKVTRCL